MTATQKTPAATRFICTQCGQEAQGNFCSHCGARLKWKALRTITSYREIIKDERCQKIIREEAARAKSGLSAAEFLQYAELVLPGRLPLAALAALTGKAGRKLDFGREYYGLEMYRLPFSYVLLAVLCFFAKESLVIQSVMEDAGRCLLEATIPSTPWNLEGKMEAIIISKESNTQVFIRAKIFGQWMDWGKTRRLTSAILRDIKQLGTDFRKNPELRELHHPIDS